VGIERLCSDVVASRLHLAGVKNGNKSNLETSPGGINPLQSFLAEYRLRLFIQVAELFSVADGILGLTGGARKHSSQTLPVLVAIRPVGAVAVSWEDQ